VWFEEENGGRRDETYAPGKVAAVLALYCDVFGAGEGGVEDWWVD
jgi:hypothetical protein